ncbi:MULTISPECIES: hypothetical protein [unclassified Acetobacterium]|uniref:hypothetical protein n=1 Tax=unclassified Acetobacterium TaxID=2638182 RepID=UPI000DBEB55F|nr:MULTISPECIES: hypothetical protein [unclassified Acetobacterium]AWW28367.1 hypothetical protein DOZ58_17945 [Acetobacterium sp. KB-1]MDZ5726686.1 hypothetical protein [Acetobacterium sp. K1/6]
MPKIEYVSKKFRQTSLELIRRINAVITDYEAQGYSLTLRQVYYQMVARDIIPNNERSYKNLGALINDARLAGLIDWNAIEDRTRNIRGRTHWEKPGDVIKAAAYNYHLDYWQDQDNYVEVWVEKDALVGVVGRICDQLDLKYFSCRGYVSQSEMWVAAKRLEKRQREGKNIVLLHLGDHDPSGIDMSRDILDRLNVFETDDIEFKRLALNMEQVEEYNPPPNPTKLTDSRATKYLSDFGHECWELDALEPKVIDALIKDNVLKFRDEKNYKQIKEKEALGIEFLEEIAENFDRIEQNWHDITSHYLGDL